MRRAMRSLLQLFLGTQRLLLAHMYARGGA